MYNRYIRNDFGQYERVPQREATPPPPPPSSPPFQAPSQPPPPPPRDPHETPPSPPPQSPPLDLHFVDRLLDKLHLGDLDSGDLLLLMILFLLFRQDADEEVLIALGLLLIL